MATEHLDDQMAGFIRGVADFCHGRLRSKCPQQFGLPEDGLLREDLQRQWLHGWDVAAENEKRIQAQGK